MNLLFIHNTIPEYRVPFFIKLSKKINVDYLFTRLDLNKKIYGTEIDHDIEKDIKFKCLSKGIKRYKQLLNYIKKEKYDCIIIPPMDSFKDFLDALVILIQSKIKQKKILYFGEKWEAPKEKQPLLKKLKNLLQRCAFKLILRRVDMCIASGTKSKEYFEKIGIEQRKISIAMDSSGVNNNVVNCDIRSKYKINKDSKIILYYGRIIERKGLDILIKAYEKIYNKNVYLLVCGDGSFRKQCKDLTEKLNLKKVIFEGFVNPKNKYTFFSQCDIFVLPSYFYKGIPEAWGLTVNEALQCGKPVIATTAVGSAYDLLNGKNGKMIKENNIDELTNSLKEFLVEERLEITREECKKIYIKYNYDNMANCFAKIIKESYK